MTFEQVAEQLRSDTRLSSSPDVVDRVSRSLAATFTSTAGVYDRRRAICAQIGASEENERRHFTVDEVLKMVEAGILDDDEHVELLDGELVVMSPQGPAHSALTVELSRRLDRAFGDGFHVRDHSPLHAGEYQLPEPNVIVTRGLPREYMRRHPAGDDVVLVVEIAETSQHRDRRKARIYAAGVPVYWLVDLAARRIEERTMPDGGEYRTLRVLSEADAVDVPELGVSWPVAELLP